MKLKIIGLALLLGLMSCEDFLNINDDPNNPTNAQLNSILPYAQAVIFGQMGIGAAGISETLEVYAHRTVQRGDQDDYKVQANEFSVQETWDKLYTVALPDLNQIIRQGTEEGRFPYVGIAKILRVQAFSVMVDLWGDIPFTESGNPILFKFPVFDDDAAIYASLLTLLDEGIADLDGPGAGPGSDDLVYAGNLDKWRQYAKSLKLNMYNKIRMTDLYNAGAVQTLINDNDLIANASGDFELLYNTTISPENRHPGFIREYAQNNPQYYISPYFYLLMNGEAACQNSLYTGIVDPRIPYYFYNQLTAAETPQNPFSYRNGNFLSIWFGSFDRDPNEGFDQNTSQTVMGLYPLGGAFDNGSGVTATGDSGLKGAAAQRILTAADVEFIKAELALTEGAPGDPAEYLRAGIQKSLAKVNQVASAGGAPLISNADINAYVDAVLGLYDASSDDTKLEIIMTEKWKQSFGFAVEAYNDIRRTGYPEVCDPAQDPNEFSIQTNPYPVSLFYSQSDITNNSNSPGQRNPYLDKVFWDAN